MNEIGDRFKLMFEAVMEIISIGTDVVKSFGGRIINCFGKLKQVFTGRSE